LVRAHAVKSMEVARPSRVGRREGWVTWAKREERRVGLARYLCVYACVDVRCECVCVCVNK